MLIAHIELLYSQIKNTHSGIVKIRLLPPLAYSSIKMATKFLLSPGVLWESLQPRYKVNHITLIVQPLIYVQVGILLF